MIGVKANNGTVPVSAFPWRFTETRYGSVVSTSGIVPSRKLLLRSSDLVTYRTPETCMSPSRLQLTAGDHTRAEPSPSSQVLAVEASMIVQSTFVPSHALTLSRTHALSLFQEDYYRDLRPTPSSKGSSNRPQPTRPTYVSELKAVSCDGIVPTR